MSQEKFYSAFCTAARYVSSYTSYRICVCLFAFLCGLSPYSVAEETDGDAGELKSETLLFKSPDQESEVLGKLPSGTVFTFLGDKENGLAKVRVELEGDQEIEGWLNERLLREKPKEALPDEPTDEKEKKKRKPLKRGAVPKDEAVLLRRDPSFEYGVYGGPGVSIMSHSAADGFYNGIGFTGGAFLGFYIEKELSLRAEGGYSLHNGTGADGILSFGLLDLGIAAEYAIGKFVMFGGLRYDIGVGIGNIPRTVQIGSASELTSLWTDFGCGLRFWLSDFASLAVRGKYGFSFVRLPVAFQGFTLLSYLEIRG